MRRVWLAIGILAAAVLVAFETPVTLVIGVLGLLAFVAIGIVLVAAPPFLERDSEDH
jgi:hypothetical protein